MTAILAGIENTETFRQMCDEADRNTAAEHQAEREKLVVEREAAEKELAEVLPALEEAELKAPAILDKARAAFDRAFAAINGTRLTKLAAVALRDRKVGPKNDRLREIADPQIESARERLRAMELQIRELHPKPDFNGKRISFRGAALIELRAAHSAIDVLELAALGGEELKTAIDAVFSAISKKVRNV